MPVSASSFDLAAVEEGIRETAFAPRLTHLVSTASTNTLALEAAQGGARHGVWVADEQTAGRGRGGHGWHSAAGDGLYVSVLVSPALAMDRALWLALATGLAAQAAILEATDLKIDIRWPNDLILNGRKCGGILVETSVEASVASAEALLRYAVIGIGINVNHAEFPPELRALATSLRVEIGMPVPRETLLAALLRHLDREISRLVEERNGTPGTSLLERFAAASTWVWGKRVHVDEAGGYTGVTAGLDARGFLEVLGDDGAVHTVLSGGVRAE